MIRKITKQDREIFIKLAKLMYSSDAVLESIPEENHTITFDEIIRSNQYLEGYILEYEGKVAGYALTSKMFSQESGGFVIWIEEIYILQEFRSKGLGKEFFKYIENNLEPKVKRIRLEIEFENEKARKLYSKLGFKELKYMQMVKSFL